MQHFPLCLQGKQRFQNGSIACSSAIVFSRFSLYSVFSTVLDNSKALPAHLCTHPIRAFATFFKDVKNWQGAVTGTAYEQATDELKVAILDSTEELTVLVTMVNPKVAPYIAIQELGVESYEILDASGKVVMKGEATAMAEVVDGQATIIVPAKEVGAGTYKLVIRAFVGGAKAEQPLTMSGTWEVEFSR